MENTNRAIRRNVVLFYIVTTGYALACSFLTEGYIQAYLMGIGLDTMAIGVYGTCSQAAALLGYVLFLMYRPKARTGYRVYRRALEQGLLLRPLGDVLYFNPPLNITQSELDTAVTLARRALDEVLPRK